MLGECQLDRACRHLHFASQRHLVFCHIYKNQGWIDDPGPIPSAVKCPKQACSLGEGKAFGCKMQAFHDGCLACKPSMASMMISLLWLFFFGKPGMAQHMCASLDGYLTCKPSMASMMLSLSWLLLFLQALHGSAHCCNQMSKACLTSKHPKRCPNTDCHEFVSSHQEKIAKHFQRIQKQSSIFSFFCQQGYILKCNCLMQKTNS